MIQVTGERALSPAAQSKQKFRASAAKTNFTPPRSRLLCAHAPGRTVGFGADLSALPDDDAAAECGKPAESGRLVSALGPLAALWRADRGEARRVRSGMDVALSQAGQPRRIRLFARARCAAWARAHPGMPAQVDREAAQSRSLPHSL